MQNCGHCLPLLCGAYDERNCGCQGVFFASAHGFREGLQCTQSCLQKAVVRRRQKFLDVLHQFDNGGAQFLSNLLGNVPNLVCEDVKCGFLNLREQKNIKQYTILLVCDAHTCGCPDSTTARTPYTKSLADMILRVSDTAPCAILASWSIEACARASFLATARSSSKERIAAVESDPGEDAVDICCRPRETKVTMACACLLGKCEDEPRSSSILLIRKC